MKDNTKHSTTGWEINNTKKRCFRSPYPVTRPTITPAALHLPKARDAALLSPEATARAIDEVYAGLGVNCEVQEKTHHLSVG